MLDSGSSKIDWRVITNEISKKISKATLMVFEHPLQRLPTFSKFTLVGKRIMLKVGKRI